MPSFGRRSRDNLSTCHPDLRAVLEAAIAFVDFSVIEGHRSRHRQQDLFHRGLTRLDGVNGKSKHQEYPSRAADILPYPSMLNGVSVWDDSVRFALVLGIIKGVALSMGTGIRCGIDWDGDTSTKNNTFVDFPHIELLDNASD